MMASELLNHKIIRMTQVYVVVVVKKKVEAVNLLGCVLWVKMLHNLWAMSI